MAASWLLYSSKLILPLASLASSLFTLRSFNLATFNSLSVLTRFAILSVA